MSLLWEIGKIILTAAVAGLITYGVVTVYETIKESTIRKKVLEKNKNAFKALIKSKSTKKVKVGIFEDTRETAEMEIETTQGVSENLYVGQVIYC